MFQPACNFAFSVPYPFFGLSFPCLVTHPLYPGFYLYFLLSLLLSLSCSLFLSLDHHLPHHRKGSNVEPQGGVEDRYELVLSRHCYCHLFLASEKNATMTWRRALAHRAAGGWTRVDLSKRAACMAQSACTRTCSSHAQMPL